MLHLMHQQRNGVNEMIAKIKPLEVKKLENGNFAIRWSNTPKKWNVIKKEDQIMVEFLIFYMID